MFRVIIYALLGYLFLPGVANFIASFFFPRSEFAVFLYPIIVYGGTILLAVLGAMVDRKRKQFPSAKSSPAASILRRAIAWLFLLAGGSGLAYTLYSLLRSLTNPDFYGKTEFVGPGGPALLFIILFGIAMFSMIIFIIGYMTIKEMQKEQLSVTSKMQSSNETTVL